MTFVTKVLFGSVALATVLQVACSGGSTSQGNAGGAGGGEEPTGGAGDLPEGTVDPGFVGIHRLNNTEYDNTVKDLLGLSNTPATTFAPDEQALGFDNIASALGMTPSQYEQYFAAGRTVADEAWKSPAAKARVMVCADDNDGCKQQIVSKFGLRAFRRPLEPGEVERLLKVLAEARTAGEDFEGSLRHLVATMLTAPQFLYRIERDANDKAHRLNPYELASRLSYTFWTTMPDDALFEAAEQDDLGSDEKLKAQVERMLSDARGIRFVDAFAGQWLGMRSLKSHQVDLQIFPDWDEELRQSMIQEASLYFRHFLDGDGRSAGTFFSEKLNYLNARLAKHYGLDASKYGKDMVEVKNASPDRVGFLGMGSFLTDRSFLHRTSPTARGVWILKNLLCETIPAPPPVVPELDDNKPQSAAATVNVRERLAVHRENPQCAGCHTLFDPVGLGLENFDGIGRYRDKYANGDAIDASGELPDGEKFNGLPELSSLLAKDDRFAGCMTQKLFVYSLGRDVDDADAPALEQLGKAWAKNDLNVRQLVKQMVLSEPFRSRRAER